MTDNKSENSNNSGPRSFDWGPPANNTADSIKEWLVYFIILLLLAGGVWILLDVHGRKNVDDHVTPAADSSAIPEKSIVSSEISMSANNAVASSSCYFVQLGAFVDETSAKEIYDQLVKDGFSPTLAPPDQQYEIYRIFFGPFSTEKEAEDKAQKLNELDFNCFVIEGS